MTDLLPRIKQLLTWTGDGPAGFADAIGLPRPVMSHILAGRNKPSLEVVQKILARYPEVQAHWLLLGQGQMLTSLGNDSSEINGQTLTQPETLSAPSQIITEQSAKKVKDEAGNDAQVQRTFPSDHKKVKQVLLMYDDGTFESFNSPN